MKKILVVSVVVVVAISALATCSEGNTKTQSTTTIETTVSGSDNPLINAEIKTADVMNGSNTEKIGTRAYIQIGKSELEAITVEQYTEFVDTVVKDSGYNWFTVFCDDGTGITFAGSMGVIANYGKANTEGVITEILGTIMQKDGTYIYEASK